MMAAGIHSILEETDVQLSMMIRNPIHPHFHQDMFLQYKIPFALKESTHQRPVRFFMDPSK